MRFARQELSDILQLLFIRGAGMLSLFLVNVIVARNFGPATQGIFQIGLAWVIVTSTVSRFGQDQLMFRTAAEGKAQNDASFANQKLSASLILSIISLVAGMAMAVLLIYFSASQAEEKDSFPFLGIMVIAILPVGILMIVTETMRGWQKINLAIAWQGSVPQTLLLLLILLAIFAGSKNQLWIPTIYTLVFASAAFCACWAWARIAKQPPQRPILQDIKQVFNKGLNFWLYAVLAVSTVWLDILLLGYLESPEIVGIYSAVLRTGALLGTFVQVVSAGAVARLALLYAKGEYREFASLTRTYFWLFMLAALPFTVAIFVFPEKIMSVWGPEFTGASKLLMIYGGFQIYQFVIAIAGLLVLVMGLEQQLVRIHGFNLILKAAMILLGNSLAGLTGVVWAVGISLFISNNLMLWYFLKQLKSHGINLVDLVSWQRST